LWNAGVEFLRMCENQTGKKEEGRINRGDIAGEGKGKGDESRKKFQSLVPPSFSAEEKGSLRSKRERK